MRLDVSRHCSQTVLLQPVNKQETDLLVWSMELLPTVRSYCHPSLDTWEFVFLTSC